MKPDIHPDYHPVVFVDGEHEIITRSTVTSRETREIDGVEHFVVPVEISAFSHPFYTGKQKIVDTEGRVDRFLKRYNLSRAEEPEEGQEEEAQTTEESGADGDA
ncbi:MAG: type B 50S ribosomal protein L31 [Bradymonadaceae bacterium]